MTNTSAAPTPGEPRGPTIRVASSRPALVYGPAAGGRVETVVVEPSAKMSLKCELPWSQSDELGLNKIAWYLNGAYLHSTGSSDTYNLTLPELTRPLGGTYSCAHHLLGSNQAMDSNNFHGAAVRVIHSHNKLDLKARAGPRLLNRRDLLAPVRSFSEPELTSNPAGRLKLTCLAQCEPLCSIDWSIELNEAGLSSRLKIDPFDASSSLSADVNSSRVNRTNFIRVRWLHLDQQESNRNLVIRQLESLTYRQNDTNFSWLSQAVVPNQLDADFRPTADLATGLAPDPVQANVLSRLELTYAQLAKLLLANHASADPVQVKVKCRPSPLLVAGTAKSLSGSVFGYRLIESETYYPTELVEEPSPDDGEPFIRKGAANLTEYLDMVKLQTGSIYSDEMQTSILLDAPPTASGILLVSGLRDPTLEADRLLLSHNQLVEISDPNSLPAPMLTCRYGGHPYPAPQFKWFFTDLNNSEHLLAIEGPQLSLRQLIEFRQRQLGADPMSAYGLELVSSIVGNYSCIVSNSHGSSKASIELLVQDRPLCRLSLAKEYLGPDNELMALLKCTIYSNLPIMEAIWFRRRLQIASNGSDLVDDRLEFARNPHLSELTLPIMVLNKDQKFMLEDMVDHGANFKCLARNLIGYSEGCELNQNDKQTLINTFNTIVVSSKGSPNLPLLPFSDLKQPSILGSPIDFASNASMSSASDSSISISKNTNFISSIRALFHTISSGYLLWLLMLISSLTFAWLVFVLSSSVVRGRFGYLNARKWRSKSIKHTTSWRYNTNRTDVGSDGIGGPFQSSKICINYYGGSNGDSEHDMVQSASQSSHYEDFAAVANHPQPLQSIRSSAGQQPIYLNGNPSLNRRLLKFSHSNTGSGDGGFGHRRNPVARLNQHQANTSTMRHFPAANLVPSQADLSATMRDTCSQPSHMSASRPPGEVPLINGARRSKIDLEQQPRYLVGSGPEQVPVQPQIKLNMDQQTFSSQLRNEQHIYDDVIYNQMIM